MPNHPFPAPSWTDPRVAIRPSPLGGLGTVADAPIAAGQLVFRWGGSLFSQEEIRAGIAKPGTVAAVDDGLYLASLPDADPDPSDFTNHSCDPNLWLVDAVSLVARRAIAAGEEITGDYALWEADESYVASWPCRCGAPRRRGRLTSRDRRLPDLQTRYRGHFSPFLNRRIATMNDANNWSR